MKNYRETYVRKAEVAQLILLHQLYSLPGSRDLIFRGGTALRWCYGGSRFSEDLDFVTPLGADVVRSKLNRMLKAVEKSMVPHFGPGALTMSDKTTRTDTLKLVMDYRPVASREKISVKLEFEGIRKESRPETKNFRVPRPNAVLVAENLPEILSDKIRALLERRYLKGRDVFDLWYLRTACNAAADREIIERKFGMYAWPFRAARGLHFFADLSPEVREELKTAIREDLSRFLPREVLAVHQAEEYASFLAVLQSLFAELQKMGVTLP